MKKQYLFCPGPVHVASNIKRAAQQDICHREVEFSKLYKELIANILTLFEIRKKDAYHAVVITGSSTAANETILSSIGNHHKVLVLTNGEFGDRLYAISKLYNPYTYTVNAGWLNRMNLKQVEQAVKRYKIDVVACVHHETSTGMINPIKEIGAIAKNYNARFFVDAVSSLGADAIDIEGSSITFCTASSGKAICSYPGTSIILGKKEAFEDLKDLPQRTMYLHLYRHYYYATNYYQTPNTPNVSGFFALNQAIKNIVREGIRSHRRKVKQYATYIRKNLTKIGLDFCIPEVCMSNVLTTIYTPSYMPVSQLQSNLRKKKVIVYGGKGPLQDNSFQIANIGEITMGDIDYMLESLREVLHKEEVIPLLEKREIEQYRHLHKTY